MPSLEVITMGRVGVDLYPEQTGVPLADVRTFVRSLGGSPTNVAVAAARLGRRVAVITKVGQDPFGSYVRRAIEGFGVDARWVGSHATLPTPLVFCEIFPPDRFPIYFYRQPKAPDMEIRPGDLDLDAIATVPLFWTTGTGLSDEPSRTTTLRALDAARGIRVHDLDHRSHLWPEREDPRAWAREAVRRASVVVGNLDEFEMATGLRDPDRAADAVLGLGPGLVIVKLGPDGALARGRHERAAAPAFEIDVVNGLGAGDAFGGALCHGLLSRWDIARTLRFANAAGAIVASRLACADAMPTADEVDDLLRVRA